MRGASSLQLDFTDKFVFQSARIQAAGLYYRGCGRLIGHKDGQLRLPSALLFERVSWRRRKRQLVSYVTVTVGGYTQAEVAHYLNLTRNSVWHGCHVIEDLREQRAVDDWLTQLEVRLEGGL